MLLHCIVLGPWMCHQLLGTCVKWLILPVHVERDPWDKVVFLYQMNWIKGISCKLVSPTWMCFFNILENSHGLCQCTSIRRDKSRYASTWIHFDIILFILISMAWASWHWVCVYWLTFFSWAKSTDRFSYSMPFHARMVRVRQEVPDRK